MEELGVCVCVWGGGIAKTKTKYQKNLRILKLQAKETKRKNGQISQKKEELG